MPGRPPLQPVNRGPLWTRRALSPPQLAALCGVTLREVQYWAPQGYLPAAPADPTRFNGDAVGLCLLIQQGLDQGAALRAAGPAAQAYLADQPRAQPPMHRLDPATRQHVALDARTAEQSVQWLREVFAGLIPPHRPS